MKTTIKERHFSVSSPEYSSGSSWGDEPPEVGCDYAWVKARTKREAKILAVKAWGLTWNKWKFLPWLVDYGSNGSPFGYCDYRALNPFKGLKVEEVKPCPVHGFEPDREPFVNCVSGVCLPYWCDLCCEPILPRGSEVVKNRVFPDETGISDEQVYYHSLCSLPEYHHAAAVYGEDYFA